MRTHKATENTKATFRMRAARLIEKSPNISLRDAARSLGVAYQTLRNRRNTDPEMMRAMGGRRNTERPDSTLATVIEAQRQGKIRAVRDVVVIGNVHWRTIKLRVAEHEGWRKLMSCIPFDENKDWQRTSFLRRYAYTSFVFETGCGVGSKGRASATGELAGGGYDH